MIIKYFFSQEQSTTIELDIKSLKIRNNEILFET